MTTNFTPRIAAAAIKSIRCGETITDVASTLGMSPVELDQALSDVGFRRVGTQVFHDFGGGKGTLHSRANFVDATERCIAGTPIFGARS